MPALGSDGHGGNCLGSVRMYGHDPERADSVRVEAAERRVVRSKEGKREAGRTTKPSRSRAMRAARYGFAASEGDEVSFVWVVVWVEGAMGWATAVAIVEGMLWCQSGNEEGCQGGCMLCLDSVDFMKLRTQTGRGIARCSM